MNVFFSFLFTSPLWRGGRDLLWGPFHVTSPALTDDVWTLGAVNGCGIHRRRQVFFFFFCWIFSFARPPLFVVERVRRHWSLGTNIPPPVSIGIWGNSLMVLDGFKS